MSRSIYFRKSGKSPRLFRDLAGFRSFSMLNLRETDYEELNKILYNKDLERSRKRKSSLLFTRGTFKQLRWSKKKKATSDILWARKPDDLPDARLKKMSFNLFAACTGPANGLCDVNEHHPSAPITDINWTSKNRKAYGVSESLYEKHPISGKITGEPIADSYAIVARKDNALLVVADGVNWGEKSMKAARSAIYGVVKHVCQNLFTESQVFKTKELFKVLRSSVDAAHEVILETHGGLTTLCVAFVAPLSNSKQFAICIVNVGDSLGYVFSRHHGIREITTASHDITVERNIRDARGAIGPVRGNDPDLANLTCSMTFCDAGDIVFLTTDGVSDNFDPVVTKVAVAPKQNGLKSDSDVPIENGGEFASAAYECGIAQDGRPEMTPSERHQYAVKEMERIIHEQELETEQSISAQELCASIILHVVKLTEKRRNILENPQVWKKLKNEEAKKKRDDAVREKLRAEPGKLDHATIVAYEIGVFQGNENENYEEESDHELVLCSSPGYGDYTAPIAQFDSFESESEQETTTTLKDDDSDSISQKFEEFVV